MEYIKKINLKNTILLILLGICIQLSASMLLTWIIDFFPKTAGEYSETIGELTKLTFRMVLYVCIAAPFVEEFIFRGIIMQIASLKLPFVAADVIQALFFSIYHDNVVQKIYAFILGLFIGYIVHKLGNLIYGVFFHMSMNVSGVLEQNYLDIMDNTVIIIAVVLFSLAGIVILSIKLFGNDKGDHVRNISSK